MERRALVVGALATVSVALAAGALSTSPVADGGGVGMGVGAAVVAGGVVWVVAVVALLVGGVVASVSSLRGRGDGWMSVRRRFLALVVAVGAFVAGVLFVAIRAFGDGEGPRAQQGTDGVLFQRPPDAGTGMGGPGPAGVVAVVGVLLLVAVAFLAYRRFGRANADADDATGSADAVEDASMRDAPDARAAVDDGALASAADRAASSLDATGVPPENDVLRAWRELAAVLPVSRPASSTPGEFADAAVEVGVDSGDVAELTRLFEAVRYGDRPADGERARRAVAALERIRAASASDARDEAGVGDGAGTDGELGVGGGRGVDESGGSS